jgi:2-methylisocitrate lyase-like PEP mutase family enzyme
LQKFRDLVAGNDLIVAPVALNPIMARLAQEAGFKPAAAGAIRCMCTGPSH